QKVWCLAEYLIQDVQVKRSFIVDRRNESRLRSQDWERVNGRVIHIRKYQECVICASVAAEMLDEVRAAGPLITHHLVFFLGRQYRVEDPVIQLMELQEISLLPNTEPAHGDSVHPALSRTQAVFPAQMIGCAGGEDLDIILVRQPLGDLLAERFRST